MASFAALMPVKARGNGSASRKRTKSRGERKVQPTLTGFPFRQFDNLATGERDGWQQADLQHLRFQQRLKHVVSRPLQERVNGVLIQHKTGQGLVKQTA